VVRSEPVQLDDTVALITGASDGIGKSVAIRFAAQGARVLVHGRDPDRTEAVARSVNGTAVVADLATSQGRRHLISLIARAERQFGRIDVLVNNAGIGWSGPFTRMTVDEIRRVIEVDLLAAVELTHAMLPGMLDRSRGAICFVSSVAGRTGVAGEAVYSATKAGLDAFAESLRFEAAGTGVHVGVVVPGVVNTGFFEKRGRPNERARPKPVPPEAVADSVLKAVTGRAEVWVPRWLRVASTIRAVTPSAYRRLATRFGEPIRLGRP
jgi:short-subunit dehydrogenase